MGAAGLSGGGLHSQFWRVCFFDLYGRIMLVFMYSSNDSTSRLSSSGQSCARSFKSTYFNMSSSHLDTSIKV